MKLEDLKTHLRSALTERRPLVLRQLLHQHGALAFAEVLTGWSPRVAADALSLLPPAERLTVIRLLPFALRNDELCIQLGRRYESSTALPRWRDQARLSALPTTRGTA